MYTYLTHVEEYTGTGCILHRHSMNTRKPLNDSNAIDMAALHAQMVLKDHETRNNESSFDLSRITVLKNGIQIFDIEYPMFF